MSQQSLAKILEILVFNHSTRYFNEHFQQYFLSVEMCFSDVDDKTIIKFPVLIQSRKKHTYSKICRANKKQIVLLVDPKMR